MKATKNLKQITTDILVSLPERAKRMRLVDLDGEVRSVTIDLRSEDIVVYGDDNGHLDAVESFRLTVTYDLHFPTIGASGSCVRELGTITRLHMPEDDADWRDDEVDAFTVLDSIADDLLLEHVAIPSIEAVVAGLSIADHVRLFDGQDPR